MRRRAFARNRHPVFRQRNRIFARPGIGAVTLALLFSLFSLIAGTWMLVQGIGLRRAGKTLDPAAREKIPA